MFTILSDIIGALVGALAKFIFGIISILFQYLLLPVLGIAIVCGIIGFLSYKIKNAISPPPPPTKETTPPNLRFCNEANKFCENCFYCGRDTSDSGSGIQRLCIKHHTNINISKVCDDFTSNIDVVIGKNN